MLHTLIHKKVPIAVALGGFLAGAIVFQGVFSKESPELKITSRSLSERPSVREIRARGSESPPSPNGISGTKMKDAAPEPECDEKSGKKKSESCKKQKQGKDTHDEKDNEKESKGPAPTVSILSPTSGRGWAPNTDMYFTVNVANYTDPVTYGELTLNLARAGSVIQTFPYKAAPLGNNVPQNGLAHGVWTVPSSLPASNDYTLEAYFSNFPKTKTASAPFSILGNSVKINGQTVDAFTGAPIQASLLYALNGATVNSNTDASGHFSFTEPTVVNWETSVSVTAACHIGAGFTSALDYGYDQQTSSVVGDNAFGIGIDKMFALPRVFFAPVTGPSVTMTVPQWPGVDLSIASDTPVTFQIDYPQISGPGGPGDFSTSPSLAHAIPLDVDTTVTLTAQDGTTYTSPILHLPRTHGCAPVTLTFTGGQLTWQQ